MAELQPINGKVLVEIEKPADKIGSVIIPDGSADEKSQWIVGTVKRVSADMMSSGPRHSIKVGTRVQFLKASSIFVDEEEQEVLVDISSIVLASSSAIPPSASSLFSDLGTWEQFSGSDFETWEKFSNIKTFVFQINFIEPFRSFESLARRLHEDVVEVYRAVEGVHLRNITFNETNESYDIIVTDDFWHCRFQIGKEENAITLQVKNTTIRNLHTTLPIQMSCIGRLMSTPEFFEIAGHDYDRVTYGSFHIFQSIRVLGRTSRKLDVKNSAAMQQFLYFGDSASKAALDALGFDAQDLGRIDLKLGFDRKVGDSEPTIFLTVEAPANDNFSLLEVGWNIQYPDPGEAIIQDYSPILSHFLRDVVLRTFYPRWLLDDLDLQCTTDRSSS